MKKIFIALFLITSIIISSLIYGFNESTKNKQLEQITNIYLRAYHTVYSEKQQLSKVLFSGLKWMGNIENRLYELEKTDTDMQNFIRSTLYNDIKKRYEKLKLMGVTQIDIYLPNNHSFLMMDNPKKYDIDFSGIKPTVNNINKYKKPVDTFEDGRLSFVYPIFKDKTYVGAMEIGFSASSITSSIMKQYYVLSNFFIKKKYIDKELDLIDALYKKSHHDGYLYDKRVLKELKNVTRKDIKQLKPKKETTLKIKDLGEKNTPSSIYEESIDSIFTVIPIIHKLTNNNIAFLTVRSISNNIITSKNYTYIIITLTNLSLLLLFYFIYKKIEKQKEIEKEHKIFQNMFKSHEAVMMLIKPDTGEILDANDSACKFYGYDHNEFLNMNISTINTLSKEEIKQKRLEASNNENNRFIFTHKIKNGDIKTVEVQSSPIETENQTILFSVIKDITKEKIIEKQLEEQNILINLEKTKLYTIIHTIPDLLWIKDENGVYLGCNKRFEEFFGAKEEDIIGKTDYDFVEKDLADFFRKHDINAMNSKTPLSNYEEITFASDGHKEYLHTTKIKVTDEFGNIYGVLGIGRDLTQINRYQKELESQKQEFETIFNYSLDGIAVIDLESNILNFNESFTKLNGYKKDELLGKKYNDIIITEDIQTNNEATKIAIESGHIENIENTYITKEGKFVTVNISFSLLPDKNRLLLVVRDTTALKLMQEQTKLASMGEMIGNIAHQWRQPLNVMTTSASGLEIKAELEGAVSKDDIFTFASTITLQANYLSKTIDDFRNFIKSDNTYLRISIKKVVQDTLRLVDATISNNYIHLITNLEADINIMGNKNEITQALINIINNSKDILKERIENEDDRYIFISTKKLDDTRLELKILDSGGGIPNENIGRIFEPYFTTKHQSIGTGLGLSMVNQIIRERHKGDIEVYNEEYEYNGKKYIGACFSIIFEEMENN
jgi:PAS domain S-box-containing protein